MVAIMLEVFAFILLFFQCHVSASSTRRSISTRSSKTIKDYAMFIRNFEYSPSFPSYYLTLIRKFDELCSLIQNEISHDMNFDAILVENPKKFPDNISVEQEFEMTLEKVTCNTEISIFVDEMLESTFKRKDSNNRILRMYRSERGKIHFQRYSYKNLKNPSISKEKEKIRNFLNLPSKLLSYPTLTVTIPDNFPISKSESTLSDTLRIISSNPNHLAHKCKFNDSETCPFADIEKVNLSSQSFNIFERRIIKIKGEEIGQLEFQNKTFIKELKERIMKSDSKNGTEFIEQVIISKDNIFKKDFSSKTMISKLEITGKDILENALIAINGLLSPSHMIRIRNSNSSIHITCHDLSKEFNSPHPSPIDKTAKFDPTFSSQSSMTSSLSSNIENSSNQSFDKEMNFQIFKHENSNQYSSSSNMDSIPMEKVHDAIRKLSFNEKVDFLIIDSKFHSFSNTIIKDYKGLALNIEIHSAEFERNLKWMLNTAILSNKESFNFIIRVYKDQDRIYILEYECECENSKLLDFKNKEKESQFKNIQTLISPSLSNMIFLYGIPKVEMEKIDPFKILIINYKMRSSSLNEKDFYRNPSLDEKAIFHASKSTKNYFDIYEMTLDGQFEKIKIPPCNSPEDIPFIFVETLDKFLSKYFNKNIPNVHVMIPNGFSLKSNEDIIFSSFSINGKWNLFPFILLELKKSLDSSGIFWLKILNGEIQIIHYDLISKIESNLIFDSVYFALDIEKENQTDSEILIEKMQELEIEKKKSEKSNKKKIENKKIEKDEQTKKASKKQMEKSQKKKPLVISKEKENPKESIQSKKLESQPREKIESAKTNSNPPPKTVSFMNQPSESRFKNVGKGKGKGKKTDNGKKLTSLQKTLRKINEEKEREREREQKKEKEMNKNHDGNGGKSKSIHVNSNQGRIRIFNSFLNSSGSSGSKDKDNQLYRVELPIIEPLSKIVESTVPTDENTNSNQMSKMGKDGEFGSKSNGMRKEIISSSNYALLGQSFRSTLNESEKEDQEKISPKIVTKKSKKTLEEVEKEKDREDLNSSSQAAMEGLMSQSDIPELIVKVKMNKETLGPLPVIKNLRPRSDSNAFKDYMNEQSKINQDEGEMSLDETITDLTESNLSVSVSKSKSVLESKIKRKKIKWRKLHQINKII